MGLPLTIVAGWALATWLFPELGVWLALLLAAALAPTDAALGVPVVTNPVVPSRVRRLITVESGLNDGIATPVVLLAIAGAASAEGAAGSSGPGGALAELGIGAVAGVAVGFCGGWLMRWARRHGWADEEFAGVAVLALALAAYAAALVLDGNGFVAAFCGGLAFGSAAGPRGAGELGLLEQAGNLVSLIVWLAFGAVVGPIILDRVDAVMVLYAVLSLTLIRMVPVALEELGPVADNAVAVIGVTVLLSVLAHGLTAAPLAARFGAAAAARGPEPGGPVPDLPVRGRPSGGVSPSPFPPRRPRA